MTGDELQRILELLERGEREDAAKALSHLLDRSTGDHDAEAAFVRRLHAALTDRLPTRHPFTAPPGAGTGDVVAAARTLDHALLASAALRSGRVEELVARTRAAAEAMPASMPWVVFFVAAHLQACYRFTGDPALRRQALDVCSLVADRVDLPWLAVQARVLMGNIHLMHGALHRALEHCDAAVDVAASARDLSPGAAAMAHQFRGYVMFEWNRLEEAEDGLHRAWEMSAPGSQGVRSGVARMLASVRAAQGDRTGAEAWLRRLEEVMPGPDTLRNREWLAAVRARSTLGAGDLRAVEVWLRTWNYGYAGEPSLARADLLARLQEYEHALALLEATRQWSAILELAPRIAAAAADERCWFAARAASAEAVALEARGHRDAADARMGDALRLGDGGSFVRAYLEGDPLRLRLLHRAAASAASSSARRVLAASGADAGKGDPLTPTQRSVLQRVAAGASNRTIAREMGISVSTVKTHLRAVFDRLEVSSRTQAVARARTRGLIQPE